MQQPVRQRPHRLADLALGVLYLALATIFAIPVAVLAIWAINPGYKPLLVPALALLVPAGASYGLLKVAARRLAPPAPWLLLPAPLIATFAPVAFLFASVTGPDKGKATRSERSMLSDVAPYPGGRAGSLHTDAQSSSDWGISVFNPPESYVTSRTDRLPPGQRAAHVADVYQRELRDHGFRVYRFRVHYPVEGAIHLGGHRRGQFLEVIVTPTKVGLTATA